MGRIKRKLSITLRPDIAEYIDKECARLEISRGVYLDSLIECHRKTLLMIELERKNKANRESLRQTFLRIYKKTYLEAVSNLVGAVAKLVAPALISQSKAQIERICQKSYQTLTSSLNQIISVEEMRDNSRTKTYQDIETHIEKRIERYKSDTSYRKDYFNQRTKKSISEE